MKAISIGNFIESAKAQFEKCRNEINSWTPQKRILIFCIALVAISFLMSLAKGTSSQKSAMQKAPLKYDELLGENQALVPIPIENINSLEGILGYTGIVNVYVRNLTSYGNKLVASRVKAVRSPENYNQISLILKDDEVEQIMSLPGPFTLVVQNIKSKKSKFTKARQKKKVKIFYQN